MNRRPRRGINTELAELEQELAALTLRVATIRRQANNNTTNRILSIGDRVRLRITGQGVVEGTVVGFTAQRVQIRLDGSNNIIQRAPHNVTLI